MSDAPNTRRPAAGAEAALEALAYAADGTRRPRAVRLPADPFDGTVHAAALHQAVTTFLANQRQGTAQTKTRSFVTGGNQKPWRQKGTGRARQGSTRSPLWPGGGTIFGPLPRDYRRGIPRKVRRLARRSALNARAREVAIHVIAPLQFEEPKTRRVAELLGKMGIEDRRVLVLTEAQNPNLLLSARNLQNVAVMRYADASAYDILRAEALVIEEPALGALEPGSEASAIAPAPREKPPKRTKAETRPAKAKAAPPARKAAEKKGAAPARAAAKPAKAEAKKPAARKPAPKAKAPARETKKGKSGKKPGKKE
ncbi:MAG TPA: 50S ribosomal protein L4 [Gemmatimonadales bacterium]|nr:50S ribosomal protein L4 [Gemmatimonadales bacterium]